MKRHLLTCIKNKIYRCLFRLRIKYLLVPILALMLLYYAWHPIVSSAKKRVPSVVGPPDLGLLVFKRHLRVSIQKPSEMEMLYDTKCPFQIDKLPSVDIQMLKLYEQLEFNISNKQNYFKHQKKHPKLKVFIVLHSHNHPGWKRTFEDYYYTYTKYILNIMIQRLSEDPKRKYIWAEISFFAMWWNDLQHSDKTTVRKLILNNQLEFVTGGWVANDEASTHWISIMYQMSEGHSWLKLHLNYTPKSHWSIGPFGLSATQPMLLKQMGFENMVIQRAHYAVKNYFRGTKNLEFYWRQLWDSTGQTEIFTQLMPYSFIEYSCGPNPEVCFEFDFTGHSSSWLRKLLHTGKNYTFPIPITNENVEERSGRLLDQLRKKSQLFKTNVLLMPLGNGFSYTSSAKFEAQFLNYEKLFNFMNSRSELNIEIQFGTLSDYFDAMHLEKNNQPFPTLSGDFFTYSLDGTYWSGYYTSRPFYKRIDRELLSYTRAAEIILTLAHMNTKPGFIQPTNNEVRLLGLLTNARRILALFQHHDAITGTSRKRVVIDYGKKMLQAMKDTQSILQHCTQFLLLEPWADVRVADTIRYAIDDIRHSYDSLPRQYTIHIRPTHSTKIALFNSLPYSRQEIVNIMVDTPFVQILDINNDEVICQVSPVFDYKAGQAPSWLSDSRYTVSFVADVLPLGLTVYVVKWVPKHNTNSLTAYSSIQLWNQGVYVKIPPPFKSEQYMHTKPMEFEIKNNRVTAVFNCQGYLSLLKIDGHTTRIDLDFAAYEPRTGNTSGAYLFIPSGEAAPLYFTDTRIKIIEGPLFSSLLVESPVQPYFQHTVRLFNSPDDDNFGLEIENIVDISQTWDFELIMRLSTKIYNGDEFFTDLNGYQMIRRRRFRKLPLSANYYPMSAMMYIQDENNRLTVVTDTPLGCASLLEGQIEIMLDRRLTHDDHLGLGEGVMDNLQTKQVFKIILENRKAKCKVIKNDHPAGFLSLRAHVASQSLLNPLIRMLQMDFNHQDDSDFLRFYSPVKMEFGVDFVLASLRNDVRVNHHFYIGIVLFRQYLDMCFEDKPLLKLFPLSSGLVNISGILPSVEGYVQLNKASLSFLNIYEEIGFSNDIAMCPMEIQAFILNK